MQIARLILVVVLVMRGLVRWDTSQSEGEGNNLEKCDSEKTETDVDLVLRLRPVTSRLWWVDEGDVCEAGHWSWPRGHWW